MQNKVRWGKVVLNFLFPFVLVLGSFWFLGDQGGFAVLLVFLGIVLYRQRALYLHTLARKKIAAGDEAGAIQKFEQAVAAAPKKSVFRTSLAFMLLKTGHLERAEQELQTAMLHANNDDERNNIRSNQALVLWKQGKMGEAIQILESMVSQYQTTALYSTLGYFLIAAGDLEKAMVLNQTAYEFNGQNAVILDNYAWCKHLCGQTEEALELYKTLMTQKPTFPDAYWNYGQVLEASGDLEKSAYLYRNALSKRFYFTSTVEKDEIEERLHQVEEKIAVQNASITNEVGIIE